LRRSVIAALDPLLGASELREQILDHLFVFSSAIEQLIVLRIDLFVGFGNRVELSANGAQRRRLPALFGQSLGSVHAVIGALKRGRPNAQRCLQPRLGRRASFRPERTLHQVCIHALRCFRLAQGQRQRQVSVLEQA
jgi:hypothetical protein